MSERAFLSSAGWQDIKGNQETVQREVRSFLDEAVIRKEPHLDYWEKLRNVG